MSELKVYTASAGSGKTHNLTKEYLRLTLKEPKGSSAFKTIQAVTFTNKATEEMKMRILDELYAISRSGLSGGEESVFFDELKKELQCSDDELRRRAKNTLNAILQDYNSFRIKTIDSFFQEVLRNLARELGLQGNFRSLIETEQIFEQAVLEVLTDLDNPSIKSKDKEPIQRLVRGLVTALVDEGKSFDPRREINKLVKELAREEVQVFQEAGLMMSSDEVVQYKKYCIQQRSSLIKELKDYAQAVFTKLIEIGLLTNDLEDFDKFSYKKSGGLAPLIKLVEKDEHQIFAELGKIDFLPKRFESALDDPKTLLNKTYKDLASELVSRGVIELMQDYKDFVSSGEVLSKLQTIKSILAFIDSYSFILKIDEKVKELQKADNVILLKDTSRLINQMLKDESGVYFLYEKLGTHILHHMIDEFQDTSRLQYENFKPLLEESLANNNMSLVVGDVKQSIYRFRNSDSSLLRKNIIDDFASTVKEINLDANWRSEKEIILFNNDLYQKLPRIVAQAFPQELLKDLNLSISPNVFQEYYATNEVIQSVGREGVGGQVFVYQGEAKQSSKSKTKEEDEEEAIDVPKHFIEAIAHIQNQGYKPSDIAILVRDRKEATKVAEALSQAEEVNNEKNISYGFISSEALELQNALSVDFLVKVLAYIANPSSKLRQIALRQSYKALSKDNSSLFVDADSSEFEQLRTFGYRGLYEALELIFKQYQAIIPKSEVAYQMKFLDLAFNFQQEHTANINDFLQMYHELGCRKTIVSPEDGQKMTLMTIHKSKGLGFPIVLIPFANWTVKPKTGMMTKQILWENAPFLEEIGITDLRKIPIQYSPKLEHTFFAKGMYEEQIRTALDELNLLYVATTRAKKELHIWYPENKQDDKLISFWLNKYFEEDNQLCTIFDESKSFAEQSISSRTNKVDDKLDKKNDKRVIDIETISSYDIKERIAILRQGLEYFEEDNPRLYGNMMHHILSKVETIKDVDSAVDSAVAQGFLSLEEARRTSDNIKRWLNSLEEYKRWFDEDAKVLNERAILLGNNALSKERIKRPDRVIIYDDRVEIIDYKFGKKGSRYAERYQNQLKTYKSLLQEMGYSKVKAYLWYVRDGLVEEVK